ncbi:MAG: RluA family pseudouridine synthase [Bacteroidia bacterium]|nr:RluA family pseudouridine synthase [Bacteroidia bacterium]
MVQDEQDVSEDEQEQELFEHFKIEVDKGQESVRIDKFLSARIRNSTRSKIQHAADSGSILANGKVVKSNYKIKPGDVLSIVLPHPPREIELIPQDIPINVLYEDAHIIVVNKAPGMVVHPAYGNYSGTLINALIFHFQNLPESKTAISPELSVNRPGLVHRIDKNTSGILIVAKTEQAMVKLSKDFYDRNLDRRYLALVWGNFDVEEGTITGNVGRDLKNRKVMNVFPEGDNGKHAVTHFKVIERFGYVTLVECKLETGRTHQIRVHMRYIGHPIFNDPEYGGDRILKGTTFTKYKQFVENCFALCPRQALHARSLKIKHPFTGKEIAFESELPEDMQKLMDKWRHYSQFNSFEEIEPNK